jgi:hypothetical protein
MRTPFTGMDAAFAGPSTSNPADVARQATYR